MCDANSVQNLWMIICRDWDLGDKRTVAAINMKTRDVRQIVGRHINVCASIEKNDRNSDNNVRALIESLTK